MLLECENLVAAQSLLDDTESVDMQELVLGRNEVLLEALFEFSILTSEAPGIVSEIKVEIGSEAKVGVKGLHFDIVVMSDAVDVVSALSIPDVISGSEFIVDLSISILVGLSVGSVSCFNVGLGVDSVVGCSDDVIPGTKI